VTDVRDDNYHALLSPSSAHTWLECEQSIALGLSEPNDSSEFADEGTDAHTLAADCLVNGDNAADYIGRKLPKGHEVDADMAEYVQTYVDLVRNKVKAYEAAGYEVQLEVEQRVPIGHITGEEGAEGTSDAIIIATKGDEALIEVIDLKYGRGVQVDVVENPQTKLYGLGSIEKFGLLADFDEVNLTISQPRVSETPREWTTNVADLEHWAAAAAIPAAEIAMGHVRRVEYARKSGSDDGKFHLDLFKPGEKQCRFCRGRAVCPGLAKLTQDTIAAQFEDMTVPTLHPKVEALTPDDLARIFPALDVIDLWRKAVFAKIEQLNFAGHTVAGTKVVKSRKGNRKWSSAEEAEAVLKAMRLKHDEMYDYELASPTRVEKVLKENPRKWKKASALVTQSEGNNTVVPESDPRPAVLIEKVADQFETLADENDDLV
jgi:hypothetical protein